MRLLSFVLLLELAALLAQTVLGQGLSLRDPGFIGAASGGGSGGGAGGGAGGGGASQYTNVFAYYTLDSLNGGTAIDAVAGRDIAKQTGTAASMTGHIGNAYDMLNWRARTNTAAFDFAGQDFCIRVWVYRSAAANTQLLFRTDGSNGWDLGFVNSAGLKAYWDLQYGTGNQTITSDDAMTTGAWHRVVAWHETGVGIGLKVDNNTTETLSFTEAMGAASANITLALNSSGTQGLDELALWVGYIPSESELTWDWNSGAGRTYPLPEPE
jgi:hypothetical protein